MIYHSECEWRREAPPRARRAPLRGFGGCARRTDEAQGERSGGGAEEGGATRRALGARSAPVARRPAGDRRSPHPPTRPLSLSPLLAGVQREGGAPRANGGRAPSARRAAHCGARVPPPPWALAMGEKRKARGSNDFLPGSIISVELTNFMTFSHVKFEPGPHLNLVIGPNGTGKSSLVCAICLGLASTTKGTRQRARPAALAPCAAPARRRECQRRGACVRHLTRRCCDLRSAGPRGQDWRLRQA